MTDQLTFHHLKRQAALILAVLLDGEPHPAREFKTGAHRIGGERLFVDAVSQRIGELKRVGYPIVNVGPGGRGAVYQLRRAS